MQHWHRKGPWAETYCSPEWHDRSNKSTCFSVSAVSLYSNYSIVSIVCGSEKVLFEVDPLPGNIGRAAAQRMQVRLEGFGKISQKQMPMLGKSPAGLEDACCNCWPMTRLRSKVNATSGIFECMQCSLVSATLEFPWLDVGCGGF